MTRAKFVSVPAAEIVLHPDLQLRTEGTNVDHIQDLREAVRKKAKLPEPEAWLIVDAEGKPDPAYAGYHVTDGFHCTTALIDEGAKYVRCRVRTGTWDDARLAAAGANHHDGAALKRTADDKRAAVLTALEAIKNKGERWGKVRVAEYCGVSEGLVRLVVAEFESYTEPDEKPAEPEFITRKDGTKQKAKIKKKRVANATPSANGSAKAGGELPTYDWKAFEAAMGVVQRAPDDAARGTDLAGTTEYQGVVRLLGELASAFEAFKKKAAKKQKK